MYKVIFYEDSNGKSEIIDFLAQLHEHAQTSKDSRVNFYKIAAYIDVLEEMGTRAGAPVTKYLDGEIWELRPLKNRILYAFYEEDTFVLLHHFVKKTRKTPKREIECAKRKLEDCKERGIFYGKDMERGKK